MPNMVKQPGFSLLLLVLAAAMLAAIARAQYVPPCEGNKNCQVPIQCYTCTDREYEVQANGVRGYPASAQCSAQVANCMYCWKQKHTVTLADGWKSDYQYKSCVPWPDVAGCSTSTCTAQYARYRVDYCQTTEMEKTRDGCAVEGGWCTKTTTECACSTELCNPAGRAQAHHLVTLISGALAFTLLLRKCVA